MRRYHALISAVLLVLAWLALDDVTTNPTAGYVEYAFLALVVVWFIALTAAYIRRRRAQAMPR
jgi:hypothetical protein